jgi:hypothetical protein
MSEKQFSKAPVRSHGFTGAARPPTNRAAPPARAKEEIRTSDAKRSQGFQSEI